MAEVTFADDPARGEINLRSRLRPDPLLRVAFLERYHPPQPSSRQIAHRHLQRQFRHEHWPPWNRFQQRRPVAERADQRRLEAVVESRYAARGVYTFTLATGSITSNSFGAVIITTPANGGINVANNTPTLGRAVDFDDLSVTNRNAATNTLRLPKLRPTVRSIPALTFSSPTGKMSQQLHRQHSHKRDGTLTNWVVNYIVLKSSAESGFITEGLPPTPLAAALDAPGMIWETGGAANCSGNHQHHRRRGCGPEAAQSRITRSTTLRTVIYGTNTISFA